MPWTQINRPFRLKSQLGDDALLLAGFQGQERISTPFRYILRVLSEDPDVDMKGLLQSPLVLTIKQNDGSERHVHGNVSRMKLLSQGEDGMAAYEIEMVPSLWFLNMFAGCRIFQDQTVLEIIQKVFSDRGITNFRLDTQGTYPQVDYCVQYRETDFNFISRLMEHEGIFYYFEQTSDDHTLVLADKKDALDACPHDSDVAFTTSTGGALDGEYITSLESEMQVFPGTASLRDYDFTNPSTDLSATLAGDPQGEVYDYPGQYLTKDEGSRYSQLRLEEHEIKTNTVRATSNCAGLECGYTFTLSEHYRAAANQEYLIVSLWQSGSNSSYSAKSDPAAFEYQNRIEAIPSSIAFRPPRLSRKPVIEGAQTAVVVGKAGEEIWTDNYGRVKVQFFWDREGNCDEKSSCWIRVSHNAAGKQWGGFAVPRIGQEVIVTFLEGDPDRPLVSGRVYNADQMPPYTLPDDQTKSTFKSMSSKGQSGFNELRFEDKAGSEQIFLHGEKDLDIRIKNDRKENILNDRHLVVVGNKMEKISGDESCQVVGNRSESISKSHYLKITTDQGIEIGGNHSLKVTGNVVESFSGTQSTEVTGSLYIKGQSVVIEGETGLTLKVGGNFITIDSSGIAITGSPMVMINSGGAALSGSAGSPVTLTAPTDPKDADDASPGGNTSAPTASPVTPTTITLTKIAPATAPAASDGGDSEDDTPPPSSTPTLNASSRMASAPTPDTATFPKNVDGVAVADGLKSAAVTGAPFCEECEKARQAQQGS